MTYKENFVVVIKHKGKILRERNDFVSLPFGSEYSILLKNLEGRKAVVRVSVDGDDVLDGNSIIVFPNSKLELKGFMKGSKVTNRFKFIQKTKEIADYRGDRIDDGFVRVEFKFEKKKVTKIVEERRYIWQDVWPPAHRPCPFCGCDPCRCLRYKKCSPDWTWTCGDLTSDDIDSSTAFYTASNATMCDSLSGGSFDSFAPKQDEGITVKGSEVRQNFIYGYTDELEEVASVITVVLRGTNTKSGGVVKKPITVKTKLTCPTCGRKAKSTMKYCGNCGTYLI